MEATGPPGIYWVAPASVLAVRKALKFSTAPWTVPPVTALRSPPASRTTGADSPVIADSSTTAMPSMTSPSPGMTSLAVMTQRSPIFS